MGIIQQLKYMQQFGLGNVNKINPNDTISELQTWSFAQGLPVLSRAIELATKATK